MHLFKKNISNVARKGDFEVGILWMLVTSRVNDLNWSHALNYNLFNQKFEKWSISSVQKCFLWKKKSEKLSNQILLATGSLRSLIETSPLKRVNRVARTRSQINQSDTPSTSYDGEEQWLKYLLLVCFFLSKVSEKWPQNFLAPHLFQVELFKHVKHG